VARNFWPTQVIASKIQIPAFPDFNAGICLFELVFYPKNGSLTADKRRLTMVCAMGRARPVGEPNGG
jgi:hypothetical protein